MCSLTHSNKTIKCEDPNGNISNFKSRIASLRDAIRNKRNIFVTTGEKFTELSAPCHKNCCIRRKRTHTISIVFQSRWLYDNPRVAIRSHTVQAFRRHLGLPDTRGLDLIVVSELASVWIPWVLSNKTSHNKLELWAKPLYDVRRFHCTMDFDTQRERPLLIHDYC